MSYHGWYRTVGFRPPERSKLYKDGLPPKYFVKDKCLTAPNMHLDDVSMFTAWFIVRIRRVIPRLVPVPKPMNLPPPNVIAAMVKEMMGYEPKGHAAEVAKPLVGYRADVPPVDECWEELRKKVLGTSGSLSNTSIKARMPLDHESIPRPFSSTCDGIYPIRGEFSIRV